MIHKFLSTAALLSVALLCSSLTSTPAADSSSASLAMRNSGSWTVQDGGSKVLINGANQKTDLWVSNKGEDDIFVVVGPPNVQKRVKKGQTLNITVKLGQNAVIQDANPGNQRGAKGRFKTSP